VPETPGQRIRRLRLRGGFAQSDLSAQGLSDAQLCSIEIGRREPSLWALRVIAARLGVLPELLETGRSETTTDRLAEVALRHSDGALWVVLTREGVTLTWQYAGETNRLERPGENITEALLVLADLNEELDLLAAEEEEIWARRAELQRAKQPPDDD
jgi:transcriptional regulator with XRE-family HTH domain